MKVVPENDKYVVICENITELEILFEILHVQLLKEVKQDFTKFTRRQYILNDYQAMKVIQYERNRKLEILGL